MRNGTREALLMFFPKPDSGRPGLVKCPIYSVVNLHYCCQKFVRIYMRDAPSLKTHFGIVMTRFVWLVPVTADGMYTVLFGLPSSVSTTVCRGQKLNMSWCARRNLYPRNSCDACPYYSLVLLLFIPLVKEYLRPEATE